MIRKLFSGEPLWRDNGLGVIRIVTGLLMAYHGWEIFDRPTMEVYLGWDVIKAMPSPEFMVYLGKGMELVTGICFTAGFLTRLAALFMMTDMLFICFVIGEGRFYYQDQHPFLFAVIAVIFFFTGPGNFNLDSKVFGAPGPTTS